MLEKFKDLLYEASDVLLAFVIILIMSTVITWKVSDSLAFSTDRDASNTVIAKNEETPSDSKSQEEQSQVVPSKENTEKQTPDTTQTPSTPINDTQIPSSTETVVASVAPQSTMVQVDIPNGTPGSGIANILKQKGLIDNTAKFIARIQELKLESKLKSGHFTVPSSSPLDDVIYIITGAKKVS